MKLKYISLPLLLILAISALSVACDEDKNIYDGPGEPTPADCPQAYFDADNKTSWELNLSNKLEVDLKISRLNSTAEADIPVQLTSEASCFNAPETVHFDAGEETSSLKVSFPDIPVETPLSFTVTIPEEYTNIYSVRSTTMTAEVIVSEWIKIVRNAEFYGVCYNTDEVNIWELSDIYWMKGQNKFRIENFLASGIDFTFKLFISDEAFDPTDPATWYGYVIPLDHYSYYQGNTGRWLLVDDNDEAFSWTLPYTGFIMNETKLNNWISIKSSSYGWYMYFICEDEGYEDEHGWFRIANTDQTYVWIYWDPSELNLQGYSD